ncbi:MAG: undecaprenyldiphospho-muramoylpentapeptide beta-N-acetylglucosaminyltransferase [Candidatus Omnitrophota bacterium]
MSISKSDMKILIAAGGTGGHIFPAINLAKGLLEQDVKDVYFLTSSRSQDAMMLEGSNVEFFTVSIEPLQRKGIIPFLNFLFRLITGSLRSAYLLLKIRPVCVVGFGGYVTGPIMLFASMCRIKTIIHEQNVLPGKTNRILARFVSRIAVSFPETVKYLEDFSSKIIVTGNFLRSETMKPFDKKDESGFRLLVMGGSQGSHALNSVLPEALGLIGKENRFDFEVIHITGYKDKDEVESSYRNNAIKSTVLSFTDEMDRFYNICDFVVSRAGATTISELIYLKKPALLIPYPYGDRHQVFNAKVLEDMGCGVIMEEEDLNIDILKKAIMNFMDKDFLKSMSKKVEKKDRDALGTLIKEIIA